MRIALIADLHGNMTATRAVEQDLARRPFDALWCLGDLVGKGASSDETCDWAFQNCGLILRGNWDEGVGSRAFHQDLIYHDQLGEERLKKLASLPLEKHLVLSGKRIRLFHGRPVMPDLLAPQDDAVTLQDLFAPAFDVVGYADYHRQGLRQLNGLLFNVGSVGNAFGVAEAQYAMLEGSRDDEPFTPLSVQFISVPYDKQEAVAEMDRHPLMPYRKAFESEILTGAYYSRFGQKAF